jgi:hypothetical protein
LQILRIILKIFASGRKITLITLPIPFQNSKTGRRSSFPTDISQVTIPSPMATVAPIRMSPRQIPKLK